MGSRSLVATQKDLGDSSVDFGTSNVTLGSISVPAGTWLFIFKVNCNFSVAQDTYATGEIYNSTDAAVLDTGYSGVDWPGGTVNARVPMTVVTVATLGATNTIISRIRANDASGTSQADSANLIAVPVGV